MTRSLFYVLCFAMLALFVSAGLVAGHWMTFAGGVMLVGLIVGPPTAFMLFWPRRPVAIGLPRAQGARP